MRHLLAHGGDLLDDQRRARERFQNRALAALDTARNLDLSLAREQWDRAHFAQVHAHRIVDFLAHAGGEVEIENLVALFELLFEILSLFEDFDAGDVQAGQYVVQFRSAGKIRGQNFTDFIVQNVPFVLTDLYKPCSPSNLSSSATLKPRHSHPQCESRTLYITARSVVGAWQKLNRVLAPTPPCLPAPPSTGALPPISRRARIP